MLRKTKNGTETQRYIDIGTHVKRHDITFAKLTGDATALTVGMTLAPGSVPVHQIIATAFLDEKFLKIAENMFQTGHDATYDVTFACTNDMVITELMIELPENLSDSQNRKLVFEFGLALTGLTENELSGLVKVIGTTVSPKIYLNHPQ